MNIQRTVGFPARNRSEIVGAVDFGSREVRVIIARKNDDGAIQIMGKGSTPAMGCVSQGVIQDLQAAQMALKQALTEAEQDARIHVTSLFCGINGKNVDTFIREGNVQLEREVVEQSHMDEALDFASRDVLEAGKRIVSSLAAQEWYVDDMRVNDPIGISGQVLKTRVHFARIPAVIEDNILQCIESQRRELEDMIFMPLASALGSLTPEDRELGVAVLDIGRTTTGLSVFRDRRILDTHCFEWGGYHLTRDVAAGLHVSFEEADELILEYGLSDSDVGKDGSHQEFLPTIRSTQTQIKLRTAVHGAPSVVPREDLDMIVYERANELLTKVRQFLHARGLEKHLIRGVVLTGGASKIHNISALSESVFQVPCRMGIPGGVDFITPAAQAPEYSGLIGVVRHGFDHRNASRTGRLNLQGPVLQKAKIIGQTFKKYFF
jgi:cell division protein FtsA